MKQKGFGILATLSSNNSVEFFYCSDSLLKLRRENLNYGFRVVARDNISWLAFLTFS